ncbi:ABC transporter permease [Saccharomonospora sp. NPDC006951]
MRTDLVTNIRAELTKQRKRPAHWLLLAVAVLLTLTFAYLIPYLGLADTPEGVTNGRGIGALLPPAFVGNVIAGTPLFVGALAVIFGVLVAGSEYNWESWKTVLAQGPSRLTVLGAKMAVLVLGTLVLLGTLLAAGAAASALVGVLKDQPLDWPSVSAILLGAGGGWLITTMWAMLGVVLAIGFRGVALPIGLGLVWLLAVQNLLAVVAAPLLDWVADLQLGLPGPNAGSLVAALGAPPGTPGVDALTAAPQATLVIAAYLIGFAVLGAWLFRRRDIA